MSLGVIHPDIIRFFFGSLDDLPRGGQFVADRFEQAAGYHVFRLVHDCVTGGNFPLSALWNNGNRSKMAQVAVFRSERAQNLACRDIDAAWACLLDIFPDAENAPIAKCLGIIPYRQLSILEQSLRLHANFRFTFYTLKLRSFVPFARAIVELPATYRGLKTLRATVEAFSDIQHRRIGFPQQTNLERLCSSPLDLLSRRGRVESGLTTLGWTVSVWHPFVLGGVLTLSVFATTIYFLVVLSFLWWWIMPNFLTIGIWCFWGALPWACLASFLQSIASHETLLPPFSWPYFYPRLLGRREVVMSGNDEALH